MTKNGKQIKNCHDNNQTETHLATSMSFQNKPMKD